MYTLVYQNNEKYQGGGGPLCPMRWPPLPRLGKGGHFESKFIWPVLYVSTLHVPYIEQSLVLK